MQAEEWHGVSACALRLAVAAFVDVARLGVGERDGVPAMPERKRASA
jgi:hypothetical protein